MSDTRESDESGIDRDESGASETIDTGLREEASLAQVGRRTVVNGMLQCG